MNIIACILFVLVSFYMLVLIARAVFDFIRMFAHSWRPRGFVLVLANLIYGATDPPLRFLGKLIPPLRIGTVALDLGFLLLFFGLVILQTLLSIPCGNF